MTPPPDYYEALQVHPSADPEVIQAAYRRLAQKYHPDVYHGPDAQKRMTAINQAYAVLGDPAQRLVYDRQRHGGSAVRATPTGAGRAAASAGPVLRLSTITIDFGSVPAGRARTSTLRVINEGKGNLSGVVVSHVPWLKVSPAEFSGNLNDIVVRFQPTTAGNYNAAQAMEVYSNGGRISVSVRGQLVADRTLANANAAQTTRMGHIANRRSMDVARPSPMSVPFSAWVVAGALASSIVWLFILPVVAIVPIGLGTWLLWERHFAKQEDDAAEPIPRQGVARGGAVGRCNACNATINLARAAKCARCGGTVCTACGSCPCGFSQRAHA